MVNVLCVFRMLIMWFGLCRSRILNLFCCLVQVQDAKVLLNTLITGFKHLLYSMVNFGNTTRHPPSRNPAQPLLPSVGLREDEVRLTIRLLTCGVSCLTLYTQTSENRDPINNYADVFAVLTVWALNSHQRRIN